LWTRSAWKNPSNQFGSLATDYWLDRNFTAPEQYGFNTNNLQITFELKSGENWP